jgi:sarcosine oxidase gamma subunit
MLKDAVPTQKARKRIVPFVPRQEWAGGGNLSIVAHSVRRVDGSGPEEWLIAGKQGSEASKKNGFTESES